MAMTVTWAQAIASLRKMAQALSSATDLDTTLLLIANKTTEAMRVDSCTIYLLEPDQKTLRLRATTGLGEQYLGFGSLRIGEGMTGMAAAENRPILAAIARQHPYFKLVDREREEGLTSLLAVPLLIDKRQIGAMNVQTRAAHNFTDEEIETLSLIADLAAGALYKAQLHDRMVMQLNDFQAVATVSEAFTSSDYLDDMLHVVTDMAATTMNVAVCSIFLINEQTQKLELRSAKRLKSDYQMRPPLDIGQGVVGDVAKTGVRAEVVDISAEPRYAFPEFAQADGLASMLAVPLSVQDRVIGVLACYTNKRHQFGSKQIALFSTLANQTALAIENAQLATNAAIIKEMHHRIKNNLQMVVMLMQLQLPDAERLDTREVLETNMHRIRSIATVHEVLSDKGLHLVDVRDVLERIARATTQTVNTPNRPIQIDVLGEMLSMPSQQATALTLVINELILNAIEHGFAGQTSGHVVISIGRTTTHIALRVRDNGVGIPEQIDTGLGLEIVETLVADDLDGQLAFKRLEVGTEVEILMPRE
ncbi:MAG: sensor histidine kinase [Candidatus Promineifilaceae bacterium]